MRIIFINHYAGTFGGVEAYVRRCAIALRELGHQCTLGFLSEIGPHPGEYLSAFNDSFRRDTEEDLAVEIRAREADVLFLHKIGAVRPFLSFLGRIKVVRYIHDHDLCCPRRHKYFAWTGRICQRPAGAFCHLDGGFIERRGKSLALRPSRLFFAELQANKSLDLLLVGSRFMRRELEMNGFDPERVAILPPATPPFMTGTVGDNDFFKPNRSPDPSNDETMLLYAGQLIRGKGVDILLRAFARICADRPALRLVIAGSGNAEMGLKALATRLGIAPLLRFAGQLRDAELQGLYDRASLLVVPSRWPEPFGMVGLEAMRRGLAVVASDAGGIADWLEHGVTGLLVPPGDSGVLASAIATVVDSPELAKAYGQAGMQRAARDFDFAGSVLTLSLYLAGRTP